MNLSKTTIDILKNFSSINQSICIKSGNQIQTLSIQKNILGRATVEEVFPRDFAIYDLSEFLGGLSLLNLESVDFDFSNDSYLNIKEGKSRIKYFYADPTVITTVPNGKRPEIPSKDVTFSITQNQIATIIRAASTYQIEDLSVIGEAGVIRVVVRDKKNDTSNSFSIVVGETDKSFCFNFKVENLKMLSGDYFVEISKKNASMFKNTKLDLEYLIALEPDSSYE
jgi:hypothetical protein